jgi:hypothetical protein
MQEQATQERARASAAMRAGNYQPPIMQPVIDGWHKHFASLRRFIDTDSLNWFKPGLAVVYGSKGVVRKLEVRSMTDPRDQFIGRDLPMLEFALLTTPVDAQRGEQYMQQFYAKLAEGIVSAVNENRAAGQAPIEPPAGTLVAKQDLEVGVPVWTFDTAWLKQMASTVQFGVEGDLVPHYFMHDGVLVFSTSPRLSKQLLESARSGNVFKLPPPAGTQGQLTGAGQFDGKLGAAIFDTAAVWFDALVTQLVPPPAAATTQDKNLRHVGDIFRGIGEYFALIDHSSWEIWQDGSTGHTSGEMTFVKETPASAPTTAP